MSGKKLFWLISLKVEPNYTALLGTYEVSNQVKRKSKLFR